MNRYRTPLRFTVLWAVSLAVLMALEIAYNVSSYLPFAEKDMEAVYMAAAGVLAWLGVTVWNYFSDKKEAQ